MYTLHMCCFRDRDVGVGLTYTCYSDNPCIATFHLQTPVGILFFSSCQSCEGAEVMQMTMFGTRSVFVQLRHFEITNSPRASRQREIPLK
jgi:hypothetical protein